MSDLESLFEQWLAGELNDQQLAEFHRRCDANPEWAHRVQTAAMLQSRVKEFVPQEVPRWQRDSTFVAPDRGRGWQWQSTLSMAMSFVAICMVLLRVNVQVNDGSLTVSFAGAAEQQQVKQLVAAQMATYEQQQQLALTQFSQNLQAQQKLNNAQLSNYLLTSSRKERREDFADLIKYVNQQRSDDQVFFAKQLNKLQQDIYSEPAVQP